MSDRIALGIVGCGFFAQNHLHAWADLKDHGVEIAAVCDVDPARAKAAAQAYGAARYYTDAEAMLAEQNLGLLDIVTQLDTHRRLVELAMRRGVPAIVQKPFGRDLADCQAMVEASEAAGVFLAVHENFRFQTPMRRAIQVLRSGAIGDPSWARISFRTGYDIYKGQPYLLNEERFVILDLGTHVLDLARVFLGEAEHVSAQTQKRNPRVRGEDTATMLVKHRAGGVSVVECTYEARRVPDIFPQTRIEIEGERGAIVVRAGPVMEVTVDGRMDLVEVDAPVLPWAERPWHIVQESVYATCAHMLAAVRAGRSADTGARDNLRTFALCEAAYESAASGKAARPRAG